MERRKALRAVLLIWLGSTVLVGLDWWLATTLKAQPGPATYYGDGTPNWLDALAFAAWALLAGRWLDSLAERLEARRITRWAAFVFLLLALLWIVQWILAPLVVPFPTRTIDTLLAQPSPIYRLIVRPYQLNRATLTQHVQAIALIPALGFGLAALALAWRVCWRTLAGDARFELRRNHVRDFLLFWLGSAVLISLDALLSLFPATRGTPNWIDGWLFVGWLMLGRGLLDGPATWLQRRKRLLRATIVLSVLSIVWLLPWLLLSTVGDGLWNTRTGQSVFLDLRRFSFASLLRTLPQTPYAIRYWLIAVGGYYGGPFLSAAALIAVGELALGGGLGLTLLALGWLPSARALLALPAIGRLQGRIARPVQRAAAVLRRTHVAVFLLLWLATYIVFLGFFLVAIVSNGSTVTGILDWLVFVAWVGMMSHLLAAAAHALECRRILRWVSVILFLLLLGASMALLSLASILLAIGSGISFFLASRWLGTPAGWVGRRLGRHALAVGILGGASLALILSLILQTPSSENRTVAAVFVGIGLGSTLLALTWRVTARVLLGIPLIAGIPRTRAWRWGRRVLVWAVVALLILDATGVLLTTQPTEVTWQPVATSGFPAGAPPASLTLFAPPDGKSLLAAGSIEATNSRFSAPTGVIFRSVDNGQSWQPTGSAIRGDWKMIVGPNGRILYAGVGGFGPSSAGGVYRSDDGGHTWRVIWPMNQQVQALCVGPDRKSLFAVVGNVGVAFTLYRSPDEGATWQELGQQSSFGNEVNTCAGEPGSGHSLFVGAANGGFRSSDDGKSWQPIRELNKINVRALLLEPDETGFLAGTDSGMFRSDDGGASWQAANSGLSSRNILALAAGPGGNALFAGATGGLFRSDDGGRSWQALPEFVNQSVSTLAPSLGGKGLLVGARDSQSGSRIRIYHVDYTGQSWQRADYGLVERTIQALARSLDGKYLFAGTMRGGVFRSDDGGRVWQPVNQGLTALSVQALVVGPDNQRVFAGTSSGVFRSDDGGRAWQPVNQGLGNLKVYALALGSDNQRLYAAAAAEIYRSDNGGLSWRSVATPGGTILTLALGNNDQQLFAGSGDGFYRSDNGGLSWQRYIIPSGNTLALAADPNNRRIFVGSSSTELFDQTRGMFFSLDDEAQFWHKLPSTDGNVQVLAIEPGGRRVFAATSTGEILRSEDGSAWTPVGPGIHMPIQALVAQPSGQQLVAGTTAGGVYRSEDGGQSWAAANNGLTDVDVASLHVGPDNQSLFADVSGDVFTAGGDGTSWQPLNGSLADYGISRQFPQSGWLSRMKWTTLQVPQAVAVHGDHATLYTPAGAGMLLHYDDESAPMIWNTPSAYLTMVAFTWQVLNWVGANALVLSIGLGMALLVALVYVYAGVARPNQLQPATVFWLLRRPRHLLAAASYRSYAERWSSGDVLERLAVLIAPTAAGFSTHDLETSLHHRDAIFDPAGLQSALAALTQRGLLVREEASWRIAEPLLVEVQRRELAPEEAARLADQTRRDHPLYAEAQRFLIKAGFSVQGADPFGLRCTSDLPLWSDITPLYVRLVLDRSLDLDEFQALNDAAQLAYGADVRGHTAAVVIDRPPRAGDLYQIFALRAQAGLTIVPLPGSLMVQARIDGRELETLKEQLDLYVGRTDLYDVRAAVSDVLSFFGRTALLADLQRRLTSGRSVAVFGVRKMGKSSLMGRLRDECGWPVAVVDLEGFVGGLGYVYGEALHSWRAAVSATHPDLVLPDWSTEQLRSEPAAQAQAFRRTISELLDLLGNLPGRPGLLLFLDEFDVLFGQSEYDDFAAVLRGIAESPRWRGRFAILASGLDPALNRSDRLNGQRNPFFAFFGEIPLVPLEQEDARTMIVSIGGQMGVSYADAAMATLVKAGGGHPFLTRQLCSQAIRGLERPITVTAERATEAVEAYLRLARNYLAESLWGVESGGPPEAEAELLKQLAIQPQTDDVLIPDTLPPEDRRVRQIAFDHLVDQSLIRRVAGLWELTIPVYRRWIRRYILALREESGRATDNELSAGDVVPTIRSSNGRAAPES